TLTVSPNRSQFFPYDTINLTCVSDSIGWTVKRTTKNVPEEKCKFGWAIPKESSCIIEKAYRSDTAVYWCESQQRDCSNKVNLTVTDTTVILESPPFPVVEGENVTLGCSYKEEDDERSTSDFFGDFYKDNIFIGKNKPAKITIKAKEGFYKCRHPSKGDSPKSWLAVREAPATTSLHPTSIPWNRVVIGTLLFILYNIILILCIYVYRQWARARMDAKRTAADHIVMD
ncbi:PREDICTED: Fc receptor-like protein 5, partial [Cyprinodon variegatus]|uniref:Fc receptor-like protein 5 n=1 Tax=Cyprinodon variegatus TaxID=28743 RepID=UPI0007425484